MGFEYERTHFFLEASFYSLSIEYPPPRSSVFPFREPFCRATTRIRRSSFKSFFVSSLSKVYSSSHPLLYASCIFRMRLRTTVFGDLITLINSRTDRSGISSTPLGDSIIGDCIILLCLARLERRRTLSIQ